MAGKVFDVSVDIIYGALWPSVALLGLIGLFIPAARWPGLLVLVIAGWFAGRAFLNAYARATRSAWPASPWAPWPPSMTTGSGPARPGT